MVKSIGLDIVEISRIEDDINKYGDKFLNKVLSAKEQETYHLRADKKQYLSGRFAAKEAVIKALGYYLTEKPSLVEIEILNNSTGQPELTLSDRFNSQTKNAVCFLSITHEKSVAAAVAIFTEE